MRWVAAVAICLVFASHARAQGDWGVRRDPFDAGVVRRYKALLAKDPHDAGALRQLLALYKRYRTVDKLDAEYRTQLGGGEDWATLVVLARLPRTSRTDTTALWKRALAARPEDAHGWLALGDLAFDGGTAKGAYRRAADHATTPKQKRAALMKLVGAARSAGDAKMLDAAYTELITLAPKDGGLWLERGNAQLAAGRATPAFESFVTAEGLLARDPERRLTAMMNQGLALERLGSVDEAIAQYERTLDKMPRGYFLGRDLVLRIVDVDRKRKQLPAAIARLEKRWPERTRRHFEWAMLGDLYKEALDETRAIAAYKRAVAKAPTEVVTQRALIALLDKSDPAAALAQHEAAARVAPGDADLQLELAKRYHPVEPGKALVVLERLARRFARNVNVRKTIAALYDQWELPARAIIEYEAIAAIEPEDEDHHIVLGDAYWRGGDQVKAKAAWDRLAKVGTAAALLRHGDVLSLHDQWADAATAYTKSLALDATNPATLRGRAQALDELGRYAEAVADARRAVALIGHATREDGNRERHLLVRLLGRWHAADGSRVFPSTLVRWRFAFARGDIAAGYLLVAHHARIASHQHHDTLAALYKRVPTDDSLGLALARSYANRKEFDKARTQYERIAKRTPTRAEDIAKQLVRLEEDKQRAEQEARFEEEGLALRERQRQRALGRGPDIVGKHRRVGFRFAVGSDIRETGSAILGLGFYRMHGIAEGTSIATRLEWAQRDDENEEVNAVGIGVALTRRFVDARKFELAVGLGPRFEVRYGSDAAMSSWNRGAIGADLTLEAIPRSLPATLGLRFHQTLTDPVKGTAMLVELGFEWR